MGIGIVLLLAGAEGIARGASGLALRFGLKRLFAGLTLIGSNIFDTFGVQRLYGAFVFFLLFHSVLHHCNR